MRVALYVGRTLAHSKLKINFPLHFAVKSKSTLIAFVYIPIYVYIDSRYKLLDKVFHGWTTLRCGISIDMREDVCDYVHLNPFDVVFIVYICEARTCLCTKIQTHRYDEDILNWCVRWDQLKRAGVHGLEHFLRIAYIYITCVRCMQNEDCAFMFFVQEISTNVSPWRCM